MTGPGIEERITTSLVIRVLDGDDAGWERLVCLYSPSIDGLMSRYRVLVSERDSARNQVFAEAFSSLDSFVGRNGSKSFLAWLWTITRRQVRQMVVAEQSRPDRASGGSQILDALNKCPDKPSADDHAEVLRQVLLRLCLGKADTQLLNLYHIEGLPASEIGRRLKISDVAVRQRAARLLKRIRDEVGDLETWLIDGA